MMNIILIMMLAVMIKGMMIHNDDDYGTRDGEVSLPYTHMIVVSFQTFNINHANIYIANIYSHFHNKHSISTTPIYT